MPGIARKWLGSITIVAAAVMAMQSALWAEPPGPPKPPEQEPEAMDNGDSGLEVSPGMIRIDPKAPIWVDSKHKVVAVDGKICLRQGPMEFFACPKDTKDYESMIAIFAKPSQVHAALLVLGAQNGKPAQFQPEFRPATGDEVGVFVMWKDTAGQLHKVRAQELIRYANAKKEMQEHWVFAGSGFWKDEVTGQEMFAADSGEFICLANTPGAMLDVPVEKTRSAAYAGQSYVCFTEHIPPLGTKVRLLLVPKITRKPAASGPVTKSPAAAPTHK